jgi:hypothetical protein
MPLPEDYIFLQVDDQGNVTTKIKVDREAFNESNYFKVNCLEI